MTPFARLYLDTNIFIYAFEELGLRSDLLSGIFAAAPTDRRDFATSELSLSELLVKPYRSSDDIIIDRYEAFLLTSEWLDVLPVSRSVLVHAAVLRAHYGALKLPDAIHLSTAIAAGCSHFLTGDQGLAGQMELVQSRHGVTRQSPPITIIRPDEPTLTSLLKSLSA